MKSIVVQGNQFDLPCPLPLNYIHVKDLVCGNGESPIDETPFPITAAGNLRESQIDPFFGILEAAIPPETEQSSDESLDGPEVDVGPVPEPEVDIEFTQSELASTENENGCDFCGDHIS